jgi:glucans biosynthesis protein
MADLDRRRLILGGLALPASLSFGSALFGRAALAAGHGLSFGPAAPYSFGRLLESAETLAGRPYQPPPQVAPPAVLEAVDYQALGDIHFKPECALFADGPGAYPVTFFHLGRFFQKPVRMYAVDAGAAREIIYEASDFDMPADSPARKVPKNAGFAGFRFQESRFGDQKKLDWRKNDWVAFLGASYFRAIGELYQYGMSARGVAVDIAVPGVAEEFPDFTQFYFQTPKDDGDTVEVHALLDGPSLTGAYRFIMRRDKAVVMDIDATLFLRRDIARLGLAPLTSMYWYSETEKPRAIDWRPEVHDSDGLAMWTGAGERIWRPLNDPPQAQTSSFLDDNPHGFGLLQRDRHEDHYQDGVFYERRPSVWVEPLGAGWGKGAVVLVELPTDDEIHDNIVAMWVPAAAAKAGSRHTLSYRLNWAKDEPDPTPLGRCVATRLGRGGVPGQPRPPGVRKFMVEFLGGPLANLPYGVKPEPVLTTSRGTFSYIYTEAVPDDVPGHWRAQFDLTVTGSDPVDMRCYLKSGGEVLTETWLYQYIPF